MSITNFFRIHVIIIIIYAVIDRNKHLNSPVKVKKKNNISS